MDKNAIKKFAVWARTELIARVSLKGVEYEARGISREEAEKIVAKARLERLCQDTEDAKTAEYMHQIIEEVI